MFVGFLGGLPPPTGPRQWRRPCASHGYLHVSAPIPKESEGLLGAAKKNTPCSTKMNAARSRQSCITDRIAIDQSIEEVANMCFPSFQPMLRGWGSLGLVGKQTP